MLKSSKTFTAIQQNTFHVQFHILQSFMRYHKAHLRVEDLAQEQEEEDNEIN